MLVIRQEQERILAQYAAERFVEQACGHLHKCWPEQCEARGEEAVRTSVQMALKRAKRYGITTQRGIIRFLDVMYLLGDNFDTNPELAWATGILAHATMPAWAKADRVWAEAKERAELSEGQTVR